MTKSLLPETTSLSKREKEVFRYLLRGKPNKEIAGELFISVNTVRTHTKNIYSKLKIKNKIELITKFKG